jgi:hypothetical protein
MITCVHAITTGYKTKGTAAVIDGLLLLAILSHDVFIWIGMILV